MKNYVFLILLPIAALMSQGCSQSVVNPQVETQHRIQIRSLTNTEKALPNTAVTLYSEPQHTNKLAAQSTDNTGTASLDITIPPYGHSYSVLVERSAELNGGTAYHRSVDLFLQCQDATIPLYFDDPLADTTTINDCTNTWQPVTVVLHACPNASAKKQVQIVNRCLKTVVYSLSTLTLVKPFALSLETTGNQSGSTISLDPGGIIILTITYIGLGEADAKSTILTVTGGSSGDLPITIFGSPRKDCDQSPNTLNCSALKAPPVLVDFGNVCNTKPAGPYCTSLLNTGTDPIRITYPAIPAPFKLEVRDFKGGLSLDNPFTLDAGKSMSMCYTVDSKDIGGKDARFDISLSCPTSNTSGTFPVALKAVLTTCDTCDCPKVGASTFEAQGVVEVDVSDTTYLVDVFKNASSCPVKVTIPIAFDQNGWSFVGTDNTVTLQAGETMRRLFRFKPQGNSGKHRADLKLALMLGLNNKPCEATLSLIGTACRVKCYDILSYPAHLRSKQNPDAFDTVWCQESGSDKVQASFPGFINISAPECFTFSNPDTACAARTINFTGFSAPFSVSPISITLEPGQKQDVCVTFTAPTVQEVRAHGSLIYNDHLTFSDGTCQRDYLLYAAVDTFEHCKVDRKLTQYDQVTAFQKVALHEAYEISNNNVYSQVNPNGTEPEAHDLYLKSPTELAITRAQVPNRGLHVLPSDPMFDDFCNKAEQITTKYKPQLKGFGYTSSLTGLKNRDVISVRLNDNTFALLLVTVNDNTDANLLHYCHFIVIYPLVP